MRVASSRVAPGRARAPRAAAAATLALLAACSAEPPVAPDSAVDGRGLATVEARAAGAAGERWYDGTVEALRQATLTAQTAGRIAGAPRDADDRVRGGELLLRLSGVEQRAGLRQAEEALRAAVAQAEVAGTEHARARALQAEGLVARAVLERATAERDAADAHVDAARAALVAARETAGYTEVRAPFAGVVMRRLVEPGEAVVPGQPLVELADPARLRVAVEVPSGAAESLRGGAAATVLLGDRPVAGGRVVVFPAATAGAGTVRVRVDLPPGVVGAYPGLYAKVALRAEARAGGAVGDAVGDAAAPGGSAAGPAAAEELPAVPLAIPLASVVERAEVTAVYVVGDDGRLRLRQLRLGRRGADSVEVLAGLAPGERVVADPLAALQRIAGERR